MAASVAAAQSGGGGQQTVVASGVRGGPRQIARRRRRRLWWRWRRFRFGGDERTRGYTASMWASASASPYGLRTPPTRWLLPPLSYLRTRRGLESEMMERRGWVGGGGRHACARAVGYTGSVRGAGGVDKMRARWVGRGARERRTHRRSRRACRCVDETMTEKRQVTSALKYRVLRPLTTTTTITTTTTTTTTKRGATGGRSRAQRSSGE